MKKLRINNKGMTLLEIAISLAILSIALVALANLFPIGLKASRRASNFSAASILAQRVIENIKTAASIYDTVDDLASTNVDGVGYFELARQDTGPFTDTDAKIDYTNHFPFIEYDYRDTTGMDVYIKVEDWDANGNGIIGRPGDWDDVLLSQKVYVAVYWMEADKERADTFITYISNPFYEKYR